MWLPSFIYRAASTSGRLPSDHGPKGVRRPPCGAHHPRPRPTPPDVPRKWRPATVPLSPSSDSTSCPATGPSATPVWPTTHLWSTCSSFTAAERHPIHGTTFSFTCGGQVGDGHHPLSQATGGERCPGSKHWPVRGVGVACVAAVLAAVVVGGVGYASIPDSSGVIHGCYQTKGMNHKLSVVNSAVTANCPHGYTGLDWNANGSNGYSTQTSETFLMDTLTPVASLTLPPGSYVINADTWLYNESPSNSSSLDTCELVFGTATDEVTAGLLGPSSAPLNEQTPSMTVSGSVTTSTDATLSCEAGGNTGLTYAWTASMTAVQVGSLNA